MLGQFSRYLTVGAFNTVLGYAIIFFAMYVLKLAPELSNAIGYGIGLLVSFFLSKTFTFRSSGKPSHELMSFLAVFALAYAANLGALYWMVRVANLHAGLSQALAGAVYIAISYWLNSRYVFTVKPTKGV